MKLSILDTNAKHTALALLLPTSIALTFALAQSTEPPAAPVSAVSPEPPLITHPWPQFKLNPPQQSVDDHGIVHVVTDTTRFPRSDPFRHPPGTNFLPTVYTNIFDSLGNEMPNTLPSTPGVPYNLHAGDPVVTEINPTSPTDDLRQVLNVAFERLSGTSHREVWGKDSSFKKRLREELVKRARDRKVDPDAQALKADLKRGIDILEGNPTSNREYSGFPLLHYKGPTKVRKVLPTYNAQGQIDGGNVDVHQVWYDGHLESDTSYLDLKAFMKMAPDGTTIQDWLNVPWTITYKIDVLNRGDDDFSPATMLFDNFKKGMAVPHITMDQTFFPLAQGTRTVLKIKMPPPMYFNLTYTWGWRQHPPRVQVMESSYVLVPPQGKAGSQPRFMYEQDVFGNKTPEQAIAMIGDLAPEKRMWTAFRDALRAIDQGVPDYRRSFDEVEKAREAFREWQSRTMLPSGVKVDDETDITLLYVNNTIYGQQRDGAVIDFPNWRTRGTTAKITLYNGDYYRHGYMNVDFGGARGWENQFKSSERLGGSGCQFTFGRNYNQFNLKQPIILDAATRPADDTGTPKLTVKKVFITFNFEPSRRLRFYQFDPLHHDVAIYSLH
jgi:hypothetical protein